MPEDTSTPSPKPNKGRQRPDRRQQPPQDAMAYQQYQRQAQFDHDPRMGPSYSPQHSETAAVPTSTPPRKRAGRNNKQRSGYHSDTGTAHYGQGSRQDSSHRSVDIDGGNGYSTGAYHTGHAYNGATPPPLPPQTNTPTKQQVYAGPTFLASPAASSLPMPKAFSKTAAPSSLQEALSQKRDPDGEPNDALPRSPATTRPPSQPRGGSPLDMLFNADRAEKSRKASESASPLSQIHSVSHDMHGNARRGTPQGNRGGTPNSSSNKEIFMMEMDGSSDQSESEEPTRTIPFRERMQAIAEAGPDAPHGAQSREEEDLQRQAKTRALKQLLMASERDPSTQAGPAQQAMPAYGGFQQVAAGPHQGYNGYGQYGPHHGHAQTVRPSAASPSPQDLRAMEENLRKVLKLGPSS